MVGESIIKELEDYKSLKNFLPFLEILDANYFFSNSGISREVKILNKEEYLKKISKLTTDKIGRKYIYFYQVLDPEYDCYIIAHSGSEKKVISNKRVIHTTYVYDRMKISEVNYIRERITDLEMLYPAVYLLIVDSVVESFREGRWFKRVELIEKCFVGRIYRVKHREEIF
ncbi:hypothetical protein YS40_101 [Thermus phage phiYS40]|uniref:hypothetical protein n=1 Tax=Thermus phage phiYS40 TaxID=407392 RepID=UPI0000E689DB|nr:hypothetical protein YS40_101 [Thermus phage phiYS40]ABJ91495.1 hypothetical protein YS40_101 [Thermus phage phiYS40]BAK53619.1 hypothetical protein YSP_101 [Thermus phage phiYS40]